MRQRLSDICSAFWCSVAPSGHCMDRIGCILVRRPTSLVRRAVSWYELAAPCDYAASIAAKWYSSVRENICRDKRCFSSRISPLACAEEGAMYAEKKKKKTWLPWLLAEGKLQWKYIFPLVF